MRTDPRTAWAFHEYEGYPSHPPISPRQTEMILDALGDDEHVEVILLGGRLTQYELGKMNHWLKRRRLAVADLPKSLTVTTMSRTLIISLDRSAVESVDKARLGREGIGPAEDIIIYKLSTPDQYLWFKPTGTKSLVCLRIGAGEFILRLPPQPGVPPMPELDPPDQKNNPDFASQIPGVLTGWQSVEELAYRHLRRLGFGNVQLSGSGTDQGIDVIGESVAAQVKMTALPVGRPVLQQLLGATIPYSTRACYSTSGYTAEGISYADALDIALFSIDQRGLVTASNDVAVMVERTAAESPEAYAWRAAYPYVNEVMGRVTQWLNDGRWKLWVNDERSNVRASTRAFNRRQSSDSYLKVAIKALKEAPEFQSGREMMVHYHHAELLLAIAVHAFGYEYSNPPHEPQVTSADSTSILDFY